MKKALRIIVIVIGLIYSITQIFDFYMKYKSDFKNLVIHIKQLDFNLIGQIVLIIGFSLILPIIVTLSIKRVFKLKKPRRDGLDYIAEILLPEEQLKNSKTKHRKKLKRYYIINVGLYLIFLGIFITVAIKIFNI